MKRQFILLVTFLLFIFVSLRAPHVFAQTQATMSTIWSDDGTAQSYEAAAATGDVNATAHVANVNTNNYADTIRRIIGPVPGLTVTSMNSPLAKKMLAQSALFNISSVIATIYTSPPASTYAFVQDIGQTLGFMPKKAYAQGVGFGGLSALLPIWKIFRNLAYLLLALVMVVIGFMVMFRKKIDPKTVVTVQNALPSVVMALLLITFSYAIVGICIDVMYILIGLAGALFQSMGLIPASSLSSVLNGGLWNSVFDTVPESQIFNRIVFGVETLPIGWQLLQIGVIAAGAAIALSTPLVLVGIGVALAGASSLLISALVSLGLLLLFLRLLFFFIGVYIRIILALIFSPFQLLMCAVPGNKAFEGWFKGLLANILVFPAATVMFLLANVFMNPSGSTKLWAPPYTAFVYNNISIGTLVALGLLFAIPNVGKQLQEAFKSKGGMSAGLEGISGSFSGPTQMGMQVFQFWRSEQQMKGLGKTLGAKGGDDPHKK